MMKYAFLYQKNNEKYINVIKTIIDFIVISGINLTFSNLEKYCQVDNIKSVISTTQDPTANRFNVKVILAEAISLGDAHPNNLLHKFYEEVKNFNLLTHHLLTDESNNNSIKINQVISGIVPVFYSNIGSNFPTDVGAGLARLIFRDIIITCRASKKQNTNIMVGIHQSHNFFDSVDDVRQTFDFFNKNSIFMGVDVKI